MLIFADIGGGGIFIVSRISSYFTLSYTIILLCRIWRVPNICKHYNFFLLLGILLKLSKTGWNAQLEIMTQHVEFLYKICWPRAFLTRTSCYRIYDRNYRIISTFSTTPTLLLKHTPPPQVNRIENELWSSSRIYINRNFCLGHFM